MKKTCPECNKDYDGKRKQVFCSKICRGASVRRESRIVFNCDYCNESADMLKKQYEKSKRHYCSVDCKNSHQSIINLGEANPNFKNATTIVYCSECGKSKEVLTCTLYNSCGKDKENHYCSQKCKAIHQKSLLLSEANPNFRNRTATVNCDCCGIEFKMPMHRLEDRKNVYCSLKCKYTHNGSLYSGINNPNYIDGLSHDYRARYRIIEGYRQWRIDVMTRDEFTCQICSDSTGGNLHAHHMDSYNWAKDKRTDVSNGVTLCSDCHKGFHQEYGNGNNTKQQYENYKNKTKALA